MFLIATLALAAAGQADGPPIRDPDSTPPFGAVFAEFTLDPLAPGASPERRSVDRAGHRSPARPAA